MLYQKHSLLLAVLLFVSYSLLSQNQRDMRSNNPIAQDNDTGKYPIQKSEDQWKEQLQGLSFDVLRNAATERAFTGKYYKESEAGIYFSAATGQPLFTSDAKYDSGCGWPSFFEPITNEAIIYRKDKSHGMIRTEIIDASSGSHLGHVFDDGPKPTGLRYCMNSAAMVFVKQTEILPPLVEKYMEQYASDEEKKAVKEFFSKR